MVSLTKERARASLANTDDAAFSARREAFCRTGQHLPALALKEGTHPRELVHRSASFLNKHDLSTVLLSPGQKLASLLHKTVDIEAEDTETLGGLRTTRIRRGAPGCEASPIRCALSPRPVHCREEAGTVSLNSA